MIATSFLGKQVIHFPEQDFLAAYQGLSVQHTAITKIFIAWDSTFLYAFCLGFKQLIDCFSFYGWIFPNISWTILLQLDCISTWLLFLYPCLLIFIPLNTGFLLPCLLSQEKEVPVIPLVWKLKQEEHHNSRPWWTAESSFVSREGAGRSFIIPVQSHSLYWEPC